MTEVPVTGGRDVHTVRFPTATPPTAASGRAAARTRRVRLGTAGTVLPPEDPVRLAQDVSTVDALSGGRVEIGIGSASDEVEYAAFGKDAARKRELTGENLRVLRSAPANDPGWKTSTVTPPDPTPAGA
ncbi:LLM class flavin-dependent oxidoreductase [Streptomyces sp. NPDC059382]|uniref:LLM class flavin-dependent oxidoreductase n=1 Tax=Streptomyces sp. NPDC059382 TaxID=3346816 RepID=UPI0036CE19ED